MTTHPDKADRMSAATSCYPLQEVVREAFPDLVFTTGQIMAMQAALEERFGQVVVTKDRLRHPAAQTSGCSYCTMPGGKHDAPCPYAAQTDEVPESIKAFLAEGYKNTLDEDFVRVAGLLDRLSARCAAMEGERDEAQRDLHVTGEDRCKWITKARGAEAKLATAEAALKEAREAACALNDDYMTSDSHHPGHVLIPVALFERIRSLASNTEGR